MANRIAELSAIIASNTEKVNAYLSSHDLPHLSFDNDVPPQVSRDNDYAIPRDAALQACSELQALLGGSGSSVFTSKTNDLVNLQAICRFNIATAFPVTTPSITYTELAKATSVSEPDLRRIIRGALTNHVFQEKEPGQISHTAASKFIAGNPLVRQWVEMYAAEILPAALKQVDAMEKWRGSGEPNEVGYNLANNTSKICFDHMGDFPGRLERFSNAMTLFGMGPGYGPEALLAHFSENNLTSGTLVDIGGSHGTASIPLVRAHPGLHLIVQDRPDVIETGPANLPDDAPRERIEFAAHDFFTTQPVRHADVYLFRWILHDWSDAYCLKILRALIPALKPGARVIIHEAIVPEPHQAPANVQQSVRMFDLFMRSICNGREREAQDWKALFAEADSRFVIKSIKQHPPLKLGIVDVQWAG